MPSRIILFLIENHYYCLYGTILLGTNITAYIGQCYCLISPILLPNLEPSYCRMKKMEWKDIHCCSIVLNKFKMQQCKKLLDMSNEMNKKQMS